MIVCICRWFAVTYNFFWSIFLRCLSCARFRSHFLSHLPSPFVLLVVFSCLNAAQQSSPNSSTTVAKTSEAILSFEVVALLRSPCRSRASTFRWQNHPAIYSATTFLDRRMHIPIWFTTFDVTERETNFKWIARGISAYDGIYVEEKTQNRKKLRCIYWAISLKCVLKCTIRTKRLKEISEHL